MGLDAQVIAIGPFSQEIAKYLEYDSDAYDHVLEGATVISNVFIAPTSDYSHFLAECFGIGALELGKHELNPDHADIESLLASDFAENVPEFLKLRETGFKFYYLPNG